MTSDAGYEEPVAIRTRAIETNFRKLANPYALDVMQSIYEENASPKKLEPTDLYVRFLPKDSIELHSLHYDYHLELFDHPLDIEIPEDAVYIDPTIPEGGFTWLYTTVSPNFVFPRGITHEIIEQCYIPKNDEAIVITRAGTAVDVEKEAFRKVGYTVEEAETRASKRPCGTIQVYDNALRKYQPVKGVKIRCHTIVKWSTTYTDENGNYVMDSKFVVGPHYAVVFDNCKGFDIWGNWGPIARANLNMGWHSNSGYSRDIDAGSFAWDWAAANNAGYDYYKMCEETGISLPPNNLKIWVFKGWKTSAAPMLRRIEHFIGFNGHSDWANFFINIGYGTLATTLNQLLKKVLPDITIGTSGKDYRGVYTHVNHELSHASHFSTVGSAYWAKYISYIMTYGCYGDGTGKNAELCGVGEMWGYFMGHRQEYEKYDTNGLTGSYLGNEDWFKPQIFWTLCSDGILTKKQIYDCLTPEVTTYDTLVAKMYEKYPARADAIEAIFKQNDITPHVTKPVVNKTIYTGYCDVYIIYEWDRYYSEIKENYYLRITTNAPADFNKQVTVELMLDDNYYSLRAYVNNQSNPYRKPYYPQPYHFYIDGEYVGNNITEDTYDIISTFHVYSKIESIDGFTDTALIDLDDTHQLQIPVRCFWDQPYRLWCADPY